MIELKYARKATDAKKFKTELATDFLDYGANPQVRRVICLVYDPKGVIKGPATGLVWPAGVAFNPKLHEIYAIDSVSNALFTFKMPEFFVKAPGSPSGR